jgi:hypothetical protein
MALSQSNLAFKWYTSGYWRSKEMIMGNIALTIMCKWLRVVAHFCPSWELPTWCTGTMPYHSLQEQFVFWGSSFPLAGRLHWLTFAIWVACKLFEN